jgi:uncharacterized membrane protein YesL
MIAENQTAVNTKWGPEDLCCSANVVQSDRTARGGKWSSKPLKIVDSKAYRAGDTLANLLLLNLIWLVLCLPVVTAFPSTAAMFGVVRGWVRGTDDGTVEPFFRHFKANFGQSLLIEVIWVPVGLLLVLDFLLIGGMEAWLKVPLFMLLAGGAVAYAFTSIYLFPVMVHYEARWWIVFKNSLLIALSRLGATLLCLVFVAFVLLVLLYLPVALLIAGSTTAYVVYSLCNRGFDRIEELKKRSETT